MLIGATLVVLLAAGPPPATAADLARAELDACAQRIAELKERHEAGRELERLLRRAQELASELERAAGDEPRTPAAPSPEELREQADAARDEADRLTAEIAAVDVRIEGARRGRGESFGAVAGATLGAMPSGSERLRALLAERAVLAEQRARARSDAARLDAEARAAESVP